MEIILGLLFIVGIIKLIGWIFSPMLDKIGEAVNTIQKFDVLDKIRKENEQEQEILRRQLQNQLLLKEIQTVKAKEKDSSLSEIKSSKAKEDEHFPYIKNEVKENKVQENFIQIKTVDPLKEKGDKYERYIGKQFEEKGELVIYNGFIKGYEDGGVDIASISTDVKTINLIQCKHWSLKALELDHIEKIYKKLNTHNFDFLRLSVIQINEHLSTKKQEDVIENLLTIARNNVKNLTIRKTLYISSDKVVDLGIGKHLTMMHPNIFRYRDMKIVVEVCF